ncbi:MAG TPA: ABC transporter permease [Solirubrobacterales bacterium]|nr:ABC transporter permease [Solirubrobacterales bacterium]
MTQAQAALELRPNPGPQALGGDLRRFWVLVRLSAVAQFKHLYAGSLLGYFWTLGRPLAMFGVIYVVFSEVLGIGAGIVNYPAVLLLNLLIFQFFTDATSRALPSMVSNESTLRKMEFPRAVVPGAVVLAAVFTFVLNLVAVLAILLFTGLEPRATWVLVPLLCLAMLIVATATSFVLATLFVQFRDIGQIWMVTTLALLYSSPIMYPVETIPNDFRWMLIVNPLAPIFELMRKWAVDPGAPDVAAAAGTPWGWYGPLLISLAICVLAVVLFRRKARTLAELL